MHVLMMLQSHWSLPHFGNRPQDLTLFTRPFLAERHMWFGHITRGTMKLGWSNLASSPGLPRFCPSVCIQYKAWERGSHAIMHLETTNT